jgi:hypothetical protein
MASRSNKALSQAGSQASKMSETRRERLVEIQKREQLKGLLINKFKVKYGAQQGMSKFIENEVSRFLTNERLTETNLKQLDYKIAKES